MRRTLMVALALLIHTNAAAEDGHDFGTPREAEVLVAKAVAHIKAVGAEKAYEDFTNKAEGFVDRDLYVVVYDLDGKVLAHGQRAQLVGENLILLRDPDGKPWIRERVTLARTKGKFWHDYKFPDPITKKTLKKSTYCERLESTAVCVGVYKR
jgi:cytochrome c